MFDPYGMYSMANPLVQGAAKFGADAADKGMLGSVTGFLGSPAMAGISGAASGVLGYDANQDRKKSEKERQELMEKQLRLQQQAQIQQALMGLAQFYSQQYPSTTGR